MRHQWYGERSYAQHGDDFAVINIFKRLGVERPSYLDVGAHHPTELSNTYLMHERGSSGVLVEANPAMIPLLRGGRPGDVVVHAAAVVDPSARTAVLRRPSPTSGISTTLPLDHGGDEVEVPATTVDALVDAHFGGRWPDFLSLDVEGLDAAVLRSIRHDRRGPAVICVEAVSQIVDLTQELRAWAASSGYFTHSWCGNNVLLVRDDIREIVL